METRVSTLPHDWSLLDASRFLEDSDRNGMPVTDPGGKLCGYLSLRDIMKARRGGQMAAPVSSHMIRRVVSGTPSTSLREIENLFFTHTIYDLPIVDEGRIVGIVTRDAYLKARAGVSARMTTRPTFCGKDCGGNACPLTAVMDGGRVVKVTNNPAAEAIPRGCRRGFALPQEQSAPDRLSTPLIRMGERGSGRFREAGWDEALKITAEKLREIRSTFGPSAVLNMGSAGSTSALHGTAPLLDRFLSLFGGSTRLTGSYSSGAANFVLPHVLGDDWKVSGFDPATMQYSQMIVLWGANVLEARLGTEVDQRLLEAARRGARIVVIDPRRSSTCQKDGSLVASRAPGNRCSPDACRAPCPSHGESRQSLIHCSAQRRVRRP